MVMQFAPDDVGVDGGVAIGFHISTAIIYSICSRPTSLLTANRHLPDAPSINDKSAITLSLKEHNKNTI